MADFTPDIHGLCRSEATPEPYYGETLLESGEFSDITIKTATRTIKAHKCILARLPYFRKAIIFNTASAGSCDEIDMSDDDESHIDLLLKHLYTQSDRCWVYDLSELASQSKVTYDSIMGLLTVADKYGADHLIEVSLRSLDVNMTKDLAIFVDYVMEKESAADDEDQNALDRRPDGNPHIGSITYESAEICEDESVKQAILPVLDIIDHVYRRDATNIDRRIRKWFLDERMQYHILRYLWRLEEVQEMLRNPESELGYEILSSLAVKGHEERARRLVSGMWNTGVNWY